MTAQLAFPEPRARHTDPYPAHEAAAEIAPGNTELVRAIRSFVARHGPSTAWEIANAVAGDRWQSDSVRSACARAGLKKLSGGLSPGGRNCCLYVLATETVVPSAAVL